MQRALRMRKSDFERAVALSRNGDTAGALEAMAPKRKRAAAAAGAERKGQRADQAGKAFQKAIRETLELEAKAGRCVFIEGNPRVGGAPGGMFPIEATRVDFQVLAGGISIAFDCKAVSGMAEFSVRNYVGTPKAIEKLERQIRYLLDFRKQGGIAFLLLQEEKHARAWLCFQLKTLLDGGSVPIRTLERERGGIPARVVDHLPVIVESPRLVGPSWPILDAARTHGTKTIPLAGEPS